MAMSALPDSEIYNENVKLFRKKAQELKDEYVKDGAFLVDDHPVTVQILANVSGVRRLLFQTTIVLAATHQQGNEEMLSEARDLDRVIRNTFEDAIQDIVSRLNKENGTFNGFLTLCSALEVVYHHEIGSDVYR